MILEDSLEPSATQGKHDNSGSTSSTSGYSSGGGDSCEQLSPLEPSHSPGANPPPPTVEGEIFQQHTHVRATSQQMPVPAKKHIEGAVFGKGSSGSTGATLQVPMGCPNVSLSPIAEHRLMSIPSISSGRGSFDDTDCLLSASLSPDVLLVSHGGLIKEMVLYFVEELGCELPGDRETLLISPNTGVSKFTVDLADDGNPKKVSCILLNDKDHLLEQDLEALNKFGKF